MKQRGNRETGVGDDWEQARRISAANQKAFKVGEVER